MPHGSSLSADCHVAGDQGHVDIGHWEVLVDVHHFDVRGLPEHEQSEDLSKDLPDVEENVANEPVDEVLHPLARLCHARLKLIFKI